MQGHIHFPSIILWTVFNEVQMQSTYMLILLCCVSCVTLDEHCSRHSCLIFLCLKGWGQFDTVETVRWARTLDPSRLWDPASGWVDPADPTSSPSDGGRHGNATGWVRPTELHQLHPALVSVRYCAIRPGQRQTLKGPAQTL